MSESVFPSGPWKGFYHYAPSDKHRMDLNLEFANGRIQGHGNDDIGAFLIEGRYDEAERECHWTKTYPGSHDVHYRGFREGKGIWGAWEIGLLNRGGFHIWPKAVEEGETDTRQAETGMPAESEKPVKLLEITTPEVAGTPKACTQIRA
jgi:hypothetical protein